MNENDREIAKHIRDLEAGYCNPRKFKEAGELREDLRIRGYSPREVERLVDGED